MTNTCFVEITYTDSGPSLAGKGRGAVPGATVLEITADTPREACQLAEQQWREAGKVGEMQIYNHISSRFLRMVSS